MMPRKSARNKKKPSVWSPSGQEDFLLEKPSPPPKSNMAATAMMDGNKTPDTPVVLKSNSGEDESFNETDFQTLISELPENITDSELSRNGTGLLRKLLNTVSSLLIENKNLKDRLEKLERKANPSQKRLDVYYERLISLETEQAQLNQYGRRNNVELTGIPESISNENLESKVIEILREIDVKVMPSEIEACHRLGKLHRNAKGPRRTIIRFVNRKACDKIMANKKHLSGIDKKKLRLGPNKVYANYSLCPAYRHLWWNCKKLHAAGHIHSFWVSGGTVKLTVQSESLPTAILHQSQLSDLFPGFNFRAEIVDRKE